MQVFQENDLIVEGYEMRTGEKGTFIPLKNGEHALNIVNQSLGTNYKREIKFVRFWPINNQICSNCGNRLEEDQKWCIKCGKKI